MHSLDAHWCWFLSRVCFSSVNYQVCASTEVSSTQVRLARVTNCSSVAFLSSLSTYLFSLCFILSFIRLSTQYLSPHLMQSQCRFEAAGPHRFLCEIAFTHSDFSRMWMKLLARGGFLLPVSHPLYYDIAVVSQAHTKTHAHTLVCKKTQSSPRSSK